MPADAHRDELILSFYRVRQALGWLGFILPLMLVIGGLMSLGGVEPSISDYYHTVMRDLLVGALCAIAVFLISYTGYKPRSGEHFSDDVVTTLAGIGALGVAFFPNEGKVPSETIASVSQLAMGHHAAALAHYTSAFVFLSSLAYLCLVKFARTEHPGRRRVYLACGWTIVAMTAGVVVASLIKINGPAGPQRVVVDYMFVLWFEAIAVWAFSLAWLTKGRADLTLARLVHPRRARAAPRHDEEQGST